MIIRSGVITERYGVVTRGSYIR